MKPVSGENAPFSSNSKSQSCRCVKDHDGKSRASVSNSAARSRSTIKSTSAPPCGAIKLNDVSFKTNCFAFYNDDPSEFTMRLRSFSIWNEALYPRFCEAQIERRFWLDRFDSKFNVCSKFLIIAGQLRRHNPG